MNSRLGCLTRKPPEERTVWGGTVKLYSFQGGVYQLRGNPAIRFIQPTVLLKAVHRTWSLPGSTPQGQDDRVRFRENGSGSDDELHAPEEARRAVEEIVLPLGQLVELLPRSAKVRKMQHELVEHYRLNSCSFDEPPNRRRADLSGLTN